MIEPHAIFAEDESGNFTRQLGWVTPAKQKDVDSLLAKPPIGFDNRSEWVWLRLQDGTLILGTFPQGDTYLDMSENRCVCDWHSAKPEGR